jgi:hypothetical protein
MCKSLPCLAVFAILAWPQDPATSSKPSLIIPRLDEGSIQGKTYKNPSLGLELTADPSLTFQRPELKENGTKCESLMVPALRKFRSGSAREGTFIGAVALAYYPKDQRSTDSCMRRIVEAQRKNGFKAVRGSSQSELGRTMFARTDFLREGLAYEAVFVKACDALALTIVFAGSDRDAVEKFVAATDLKLDPSVSGCGSQDK